VLRGWTETMEFELAEDVLYARGRWIEVRSPDAATILVLGLRGAGGRGDVHRTHGLV
jgi:hypothetical protein